MVDETCSTLKKLLTNHWRVLAISSSCLRTCMNKFKVYWHLVCKKGVCMAKQKAREIAQGEVAALELEMEVVCKDLTLEKGKVEGSKKYIL